MTFAIKKPPGSNPGVKQTKQSRSAAGATTGTTGRTAATAKGHFRRNGETRTGTGINKINLDRSTTGKQTILHQKF